MERNRKNPANHILVMLVLLILTIGCSSGGRDISPTAPELEDSPPPNVPDKLLGEWNIGPDGGTVDLDWFVLDFPAETLTEPAIVEVYESHLDHPHEGIIVGGHPLRVSIEPADILTPHHHGEPIIAEGFFYSCEFHLDRLPEGEGDFSAENEYIDITAEWQESGSFGSGNAWAERDGDMISHLIQRQNITLAVIDYSEIPQLTAEPIFTDDPRELTGPYARYGQGIEFHEDNLGPLGDRIPVVLIHGLQLRRQDEPEYISDKKAAHGDAGFSFLISLMNGAWSGVYKDFKFFWYCYPTGVHIFGDNGTGATIGDALSAWASENDMELMNRPLVIVAHSQGGLVAREYMQNHGGNVFRLLTVATPHYGSPIVNIGDDLDWSWLDDLRSPGVLDLACYETIKYNYSPWSEHTCSLGNDGLEELNRDFPEYDQRLICYGGTNTQMPNPSPWTDGVHYITFYLLRCVTSPQCFVEGNGGYYSDCVVPWRSQFYEIDDGLTGNDLARSTKGKYHMNLLESGKIIRMLYLDLQYIKSIYEPGPTPGDGHLIWAKSAGGGVNWDKGWGITTLSDNSTVVTGRFRRTAVFGAGEANETHLTSAGVEDIFIARYAP